jgi:hypothetical protein
MEADNFNQNAVLLTEIGRLGRGSAVWVLAARARMFLAQLTSLVCKG